MREIRGGLLNYGLLLPQSTSTSRRPGVRRIGIRQAEKLSVAAEGSGERPATFLPLSHMLKFHLMFGQYRTSLSGALD